MTRNLLSKPGKPKRARGWVNVNFGKDDAAVLKALAQCSGSDFRGVLESALRAKIPSLYEELGLSRKKLLSMTRKQRREFAERYQAIRHRINCPYVAVLN